MKMSQGNGPQQGGMKHKIDGAANKLADAFTDIGSPWGEPGYVSPSTDQHYGTGPEAEKEKQEAEKQHTDQHYAEKARQDQELAEKQRAEQQDAEKAEEAQSQ